MPSPRVMVKSCVGGGREESFSEHPEAVRIFACGFLCADFCVRIFCADFSCGFLRADFRADFGFFCVRISVRIFFLRFAWRATAGRATKKSSPKNPPQNPL